VVTLYGRQSSAAIENARQAVPVAMMILARDLASLGESQDGAASTVIAPSILQIHVIAPQESRPALGRLCDELAFNAR
jgi:hypothetical protein